MHFRIMSIMFVQTSMWFCFVKALQVRRFTSGPVFQLYNSEVLSCKGVTHEGRVTHICVNKVYYI